MKAILLAEGPEGLDNACIAPYCRYIVWIRSELNKTFPIERTLINTYINAQSRLFVNRMATETEGRTFTVVGIKGFCPFGGTKEAIGEGNSH